MSDISLLDKDLSERELVEGSDNEDNHSQEDPLLTIGDVHRVLHPLRETADRVGKQVERFAENLDRFSGKTRPKPATTDDLFLPLIEAYKDIAGQTVKRLRRVHGPDNQKDWKKRLRSSTARASRTSSQSANDDSLGSETTVDDLQRWQAEEQTWVLLSLTLQLKHPTSGPDSQNSAAMTKINRPSKGNSIHQYSSEQEVWSSYLANDDLGWERHVITSWLQQCADETRPEVESVVQNLEKDADRGDGLWAHGWLYTKEAIKAQKRLRSGGVSDSLMTSDNSEPLITQLDPDAISRQGRSLEKQDQSFEQAIWRACWEMVRRGKDWAFIREWCKERVEGWRAVAMLGDPRSLSGTSNLQSRALWRKACSVASLHSEVDRYENAVYGALSGNATSVLKICQNWEDHLFCHYNCHLIRGFDKYINRAIPQSAKPYLESDFGLSDTTSNYPIGREIVDQLQKNMTTRDEAREPLRSLQGSLIARTFETLIVQYGKQLSASAQGTEYANIFPETPAESPSSLIFDRNPLENYDFLRILTHILFLFRDLGLEFADRGRRSAAENVVVAYIDFLSKAGKLELLPLYASRLVHNTAVHCLARQFPRIRDNRDRGIVLALLKQSSIDVGQVLMKQLELIIEDGKEEVEEGPGFPVLSILSGTAESRAQWRELKANFLTTRTTDAQVDLIQGFQWYSLDGKWTASMAAGAKIYKYLLRIGAFAAARDLSKAVTFSKLSFAKTLESLGRSINITEEPNKDETVPAPVEKQRKRMLRESKNFRDFESFLVVLDALCNWRRLVPPIAEQELMADHERVRGVKQATQEAYTKIRPAMESLLDDWLSQPADEQEAKDFTQIRNACLPEVIIAYITFLTRCSKYLTRSHLLDCMDLAPRISANKGLTECFIRTQRMCELVDAFALSSVTLVQAEESGGKAPKKPRDGRSLALWSTNAVKKRVGEREIAP